MSRRLKRSDCLGFYFEGRAFRCKNYLTGIEVEAEPRLVALLNALDDWRTLHELYTSLGPYSPASIRRTVRSLVEATLVLREGTSQARQERDLALWKTWGIEARFFHFATKRAHRYPAEREERRISRQLLSRAPLPETIKRYPHTARIALPDAHKNPDAEFQKVLLARRTHRRFGTRHLGLEDVARLLYLTWGITGYLEWPGLGRVAVKTSPSGGARHPIEVYLLALRIHGLSRGIYHYRADRHELERLRRGLDTGRVVSWMGHQPWIAGAGAVLIMSVVLPRVMWRYDSSRAYRVILLEAGHFCQTFCLTTTWLGLAPFCTAALDDEKLEKALGLDGTSESVIYAAGVGTRARADR